MQITEKLNLKPLNILKIAGIVLVILLVITIAFRLVASCFNSVGNGMKQSLYAPMADEMASMDWDYDNSVALSVRNVTPGNGNVIPGDDAEEFEVRECNANIETRDLENTCQKIVDLKSRDDVIFENAREYEKSCSYTFKVKKEVTADILAIIEELDPESLNENTYTIKKLVNDYTSETEILEKKMASIEDTLSKAIIAYEYVTDLAVRTQDAESLAKIIDSKINIIERLTEEKINVSSQLERLNRSKSEQLDRLNYTSFNVYIRENKFVDWQNIKDSWKAAIKSFVNDVNNVIQDISINLLASLFVILQYIIYLLLILIVAKFVWRWAKAIWRKR